ncbi:predicted protein [Naegleria gruberi]|uniref:Predicted protein n=1 Tax=Naegleria gruberi TaxID=5762 RepID=D2V0V8_NAEGR|nr:uncharacterized protein NAEGRDRAFT_45788 [Naegleria gruberi]EFC49798.1 predicted protein [Naegleria gruberi]|eukprot:XP_002682542.1 predicted protein [Naegleria gruberi strain NEG-M]
MAKTKKEIQSSGATDEDAILKEQKLHVILEDRLFHETARTLISDDAQAYSQAVDPNHAKNMAFENSITYHPHGIKRKRIGGGFSKAKKEGDEDASTSYKVFCCCFYFGNRYLKLSFAQVMMTIIIAMIAFVAYLKLTENVFFFQTVHDLEEIDYYQLLEVPRNANAKVIKRAHREQTKKWHPDRNPGCEECVKKMTLISEAYTVLTNKELADWHVANGLRVPETMLKKYARAKN